MDYRNEDHFRDFTKMVEYVSRQAVQELIYEQQAFYENERKESEDYGSEMGCVGSINALTAMEDGLSDIPAADVRPVVYGEWEITSGQIENAVCSCCGTHFQSYYSDYQYCPHCGAYLVKENNNG